MIQKKAWAKDETTLLFVLSESDELIRIFMSSIKTTRQNALVQKQKASASTKHPPDEPG